MTDAWMIYGANGYTGKLLAEAATAAGHRPVLAGRSETAVVQLANALDCAHRVFDLGDAAQHLTDVNAVVHCAGPFSQTAAPMLSACLSERVHYLDITGEIGVFEYAHGLHQEALEAGICVCPGIGFDVVPTDCLAAQLSDKMPDATHLVLAFEAGGGPSPGTAKTSVEGMGMGGMIREDGQLKRVPQAYDVRKIDFGSGPRSTMTIPWGDVYTAYVSTSIPNIRVYMSMPPAAIAWARRTRLLRPILAMKPLQALLKGQIQRASKGPNAQRREDSESRIWGQVRDDAGNTVEARMVTPNGYDLTVAAGLGITEKVLADNGPAGYHTPSQLMGASYVESLAGVSVTFHSADS